MANRPANAVTLTSGMTILAPGEELDGGIDKIDRVFEVKNFIDAEHAVHAAEAASRAPLDWFKSSEWERWAFPRGALEWAAANPGRPVMAFWIEAA